MLFEKYFHCFVSGLFHILNPYKILFVKTECEVHVFNNFQALRLLKDYGYDSAHFFFKRYLRSFNDGSYWADQNFKSSAHFFNPDSSKGLYGQGHALSLAKTYYANAVIHYTSGRPDTSLFFLGACCHIIQDMTIPQHIRIKLFDEHRQYENFVRYTYDIVTEYRSDSPPVLLPRISDYVIFNAKIAMKLYCRYKKVRSRKLRFFYITLSSLPLSQSTTAGVMLLFLKNIMETK